MFSIYTLHAVCLMCAPVSAHAQAKEQQAAAAAAAKAREEPAKPIVYASKEAAKEAFKQLLTDFDIPAGGLGLKLRCA
jgi:hypothetical protein